MARLNIHPHNNSTSKMSDEQGLEGKKNTARNSSARNHMTGGEPALGRIVQELREADQVFEGNEREFCVFFFDEEMEEMTDMRRPNRVSKKNRERRERLEQKLGWKSHK
jgi:hypothetical protein